MSAREKFESVREAVSRLHEVQLMIMNRCEDWRPPSARSRNRVADPTAGAAIYNVDTLEGRLSALRAEESELIEEIGEGLVVLHAVSEGLGDKYADVLEWRYFDCLSWSEVKRQHDLKRSTGCDYVNVAFDWIDSIGLTRILANDLEI